MNKNKLNEAHLSLLKVLLSLKQLRQQIKGIGKVPLDPSADLFGASTSVAWVSSKLKIPYFTILKKNNPRLTIP